MIPDRIVAATLMSAAAVTGSSIKLNRVIPSHLGAVIPVFRDSGCEIDTDAQGLRISAPYRLSSPKLIRTMPYPGFPTDAQAPVMSMTAVADGMTVFVENLFLSRYSHVSELCRLGADIRVDGGLALVRGVERLKGAALRATDLRGGAAMLLAGLTAEGETLVCDEGHISRGYERFDERLRSLGAEIRLES